MTGAKAARDIDEYMWTVRRARSIGLRAPLDYEFFNADRQAVMTVRWVYLHMIEEYARHNGHADLLRERIDGQTGR